MCPLGALSGARESWEYDSGARDLQSPDIQPQQTQIQQQPAILQPPGTVLEQQAALHMLLSQTSARCSPLGGNYLELANTVSMPLVTLVVLVVILHCIDSWYVSFRIFL